MTKEAEKASMILCLDSPAILMWKWQLEIHSVGLHFGLIQVNWVESNSSSILPKYKCLVYKNKKC